MAAKRTRKSAFVPRLVFRTTLVAVVPACALAACGGQVEQTPGDSGAATTLDGVADTAFSVGFVADSFTIDTGLGPDGVAADAFTVADTAFDGVAVIGYDGGVADAGFAVADVGYGGVALDAYGPSDGVADAYGRGDT
jgi:hypothetical protein